MNSETLWEQFAHVPSPHCVLPTPAALGIDQCDSVSILKDATPPPWVIAYFSDNCFLLQRGDMGESEQSIKFRKKGEMKEKGRKLKMEMHHQSCSLEDRERTDRSS